MITTSRREMYEALKHLWKTSFGDTVAYAGQIIENLPPEQVLVLVDGKKILSMLCWLPVDFSLPGGAAMPGAYMFGFNTHPSCRGKGVGGRLLEEFHRYLFAKGIRAIALAPASESLFDYYARHDYVTVFHSKRVEIDADQIPLAAASCVMVPRPLEALGKERERYYGARFYGRWGAEALRFLDGECKYRGGEVLRVGTANGDGYLSVTPLEHGTVILNEFAIPPGNAKNVLAALHQRLHAKRYVIRLPKDYPIQYPGADLPFVMVRWYDRKKQPGLISTIAQAPYFGFILD